jgi:hypothetical protein
MLGRHQDTQQGQEEVAKEEVTHVCPVCLTLYTERQYNELYRPEGFPEDALCMVCNSDLPGDVEVMALDKWLAKATVEQLERDKAEVVVDTRYYPHYREEMAKKIDVLLGMMRDRR